jgi:hypothetical protein
VCKMCILGRFFDLWGSLRAFGPTLGTFSCAKRCSGAKKASKIDPNPSIFNFFRENRHFCDVTFCHKFALFWPFFWVSIVQVQNVPVTPKNMFLGPFGHQVVVIKRPIHPYSCFWGRKRVKIALLEPGGVIFDNFSYILHGPPRFFCSFRQRSWGIDLRNTPKCARGILIVAQVGPIRCLVGSKRSKKAESR